MTHDMRPVVTTTSAVLRTHRSAGGNDAGVKHRYGKRARLRPSRPWVVPTKKMEHLRRQVRQSGLSFSRYPTKNLKIKYYFVRFISSG